MMKEIFKIILYILFFILFISCLVWDCKNDQRKSEKFDKSLREVSNSIEKSKKTISEIIKNVDSTTKLINELNHQPVYTVYHFDKPVYYKFKNPFKKHKIKAPAQFVNLIVPNSTPSYGYSMTNVMEQYVKLPITYIGTVDKVKFYITDNYDSLWKINYKDIVWNTSNDSLSFTVKYGSVDSLGEIHWREYYTDSVKNNLNSK